jgi:oxalate decarboxylase/phosphoglucose isomerase-like protein (cupin superfamily)
MKFSINKFQGKKTVMKVREAVSKGRNIYKNIKGHENDINEILIDLPDKKTGFKEHIVCMNTLYPGKVNGEFKMMRGHSHNVEEVYILLSGKGYMILGNKKMPVNRGDLVTIPKNVWHRTVNTGKEKIVFLTIFEKHEGSHLKSY